MYTPPRNRNARSNRPAVHKLVANDPPPKIKPNFRYEPSVRDPNPVISQVTFVNKNDDIEGTTPRKQWMKERSDTAGLITTPIRYKREILITPDTKEDFLKEWTRLDVAILDKSNTKAHRFIRNQIDVSVDPCSPGYQRSAPQEAAHHPARRLPRKAAPRRANWLARRVQLRDLQVPRRRQRQLQDSQRRRLFPGLQVRGLPAPATARTQNRPLNSQQNPGTPQTPQAGQRTFEPGVEARAPAPRTPPPRPQRDTVAEAVRLHRIEPSQQDRLEVLGSRADSPPRARTQVRRAGPQAAVLAGARPGLGHPPAAQSPLEKASGRQKSSAT